MLDSGFIDSLTLKKVKNLINLTSIFQFDRTRGKYGEGEKQERFPFVMALVFSMCAVNYVFAW